MSELELAAILRRAIQESGASLNQLGKECGVSQPQLSRFMKAERSLTLDSVEKLLRHFNLTIELKGSPSKKSTRGKK